MESKNTEKKYVPPKKWRKFRHKFVYSVLGAFFRGYLRIKYRFKANRDEKKTPPSCIIMSNHQTTMDPFFLSLSFKRPVYFVMSDDLFTLGFVTKIIRYLVEPIPKAKSKSDLNTIRCIKKVLSEGGTIGLFPSGNRTLSGKEWEIDVSAAKLLKLTKVPLVLYNINGGYGSDPRWAGKTRKGKMTGGVVKVISAEEIERMPVEELHQEIVNALNTDDSKLDINFKSKKRAEYLERALYYCPNCGSFNSIWSDNQTVKCKNCDLEVRYEENLKFSYVKGKAFGETVFEWYDAQKQKLYDAAQKQGELFFDMAEARLIEGLIRTKLGVAKITGFSDGVNITTEKGGDFNLKFKELVGCTILGKRKINFYLNDGKTLQIKGTERFNGVKYLHLYEFKKGEKDE